MLLPTSASIVIALLMGIAGVGFVLWQFKKVLAYDQGNELMREIGAGHSGRRICFSGARISRYCYFCRDRRHCHCRVLAMANSILFCFRRNCFSWEQAIWACMSPSAPTPVRPPPPVVVFMKAYGLPLAAAQSWVCPSSALA